MAKRVNSSKQSSPNAKNDGLTKAQRRQRNLDLRNKAADQAKADGLHFDDSVPAASFFDDYDKAYAQATAKGKMTAEEIAAAEAKAEALNNIKPVTLPGLPAPANDNPAELTSAQQTVVAAKATLLGTSAGPAVVYDSSGETKSAEDSAAVFAAAKETGEQISERLNADIPEDEIKVCGDLVRESEEADAKKRAQQQPADPAEGENQEIVDEETQQTPEQPVERDNPVEAPVEEAKPETAPVEETPDQAGEETPAEEVKPGPVVEQPKPVEAKKPTLTLVPSNVTNEHIKGAQKLYGDAFTAERKPMLADAFRCLMLASRLEQEYLKDPEANAVKKTLSDTALRNALAKEQEAFAVVALAKAA